MGKLSTVTGREVTRIKTYCSRNFWPGALKPTTSISSILVQHAHIRATHLLTTSPTSDISNLTTMGKSERMHWIDLSAKSMVTAAEMSLVRYPALREVYIMEHLPRYFFHVSLQFEFHCMSCPRCDSRELDQLRLEANRLIRLEADNSMLRMQIHVVGNLLEPRSSEDLSGLFGVVGKRGFDGIHLRGYCGADSLFDSLVKIISNM